MGKDIVEKVFGFLSAPADTVDLLKCAAGDNRPISVYGDRSRCKNLLSEHGIKVKEIIDDGDGFIVIVPKRDWDRAHKILQKKL